ncbi:hypothetical protein HAX54_022309 [Datura stramonium]|uniref:Uncharacterized protein n=1 Tax=Datura stramonium TaxID=4076 RepID=A0ABS8UX20_DATST|nr:hypothetical protein [Datura stramonium]
MVGIFRRVTEGFWWCFGSWVETWWCWLFRRESLKVKEGGAAVGSWLLLPSPAVKREERGGWLGLLPEFIEVWLFIDRRAVGSGAGDGGGVGKWVSGGRPDSERGERGRRGEGKEGEVGGRVVGEGKDEK